MPTSNTDSVLSDEATEQLNVNGLGEPTVVLAAVGLNGIPPTYTQPCYDITMTNVIW